MERRSFLKYALGTSGLALLNASFGVPSRLKNQQVIIVGAGAAGLFAAYLLQQKGINYQIVEGSAAYGGRLKKLEGFADYPLDLGAAWLHGQRSVVGKIARKNQVVYVEDQSNTVYWFEGKIVNKLPRSVEDLLYAYPSPEDCSLVEYAAKYGFGAPYQYILEALAGDYGASAANLSVSQTRREEYNWSSGNRDYRFELSYFDLIEQFVLPSIRDKINLNSPIVSIDYSSNDVQLKDVHGQTYTANKVLLCVPITVLKQKDIRFRPTITAHKQASFEAIGMGPGLKVFLKFKHSFYPQNIIGGTTCAAYADARVGKKGKDNVLMAFVMGKQAAYLSSLSEAKIVKALVDELDQMYEGQASTWLEKAHVENWTKHPLIRGAYSYSSQGIGKARKLAAKSVDQKLFFAGEAMHFNGHHQTVHGAVESAVVSVDEILKQLAP